MEQYQECLTNCEVREREKDLTELVDKKIDSWTYKFLNTPFPLCNITVLFRGDEDTGILSYFSHGVLKINGEVVDQLQESENAEDPRVTEFSQFRLHSSLPCFLNCDIELILYFHSRHDIDNLFIRILADEVLCEIPKELKENHWTFPLNHCTLHAEKGQLKVQETQWKKILNTDISQQLKTKTIYPTSKSSEDVTLERFDLTSKQLEQKLDDLVAWTVQRELLRNSLNEIS